VMALLLDRCGDQIHKPWYSSPIEFERQFSKLKRGIISIIHHKTDDGHGTACNRCLRSPAISAPVQSSYIGFCSNMQRGLLPFNIRPLLPKFVYMTDYCLTHWLCHFAPQRPMGRGSDHLSRQPLSSSTTSKSPSLTGAWRGVWLILSLALLQIGPAAKWPFPELHLSLQRHTWLSVFHCPSFWCLLPLTIPRYQICRPCTGFHYLEYLSLIYFFPPVPHNQCIPLSTASCRVRPDMFAYMIFLTSEVEWLCSSPSSPHINVCSNAN
jgi:hypothetical protein